MLRKSHICGIRASKDKMKMNLFKKRGTFYCQLRARFQQWEARVNVSREHFACRVVIGKGYPIGDIHSNRLLETILSACRKFKKMQFPFSAVQLCDDTVTIYISRSSYIQQNWAIFRMLQFANIVYCTYRSSLISETWLLCARKLMCKSI